MVSADGFLEQPVVGVIGNRAGLQGLCTLLLAVGSIVRNLDRIQRLDLLRFIESGTHDSRSNPSASSSELEEIVSFCYRLSSTVK